jgi:hypothetical protein
LVSKPDAAAVDVEVGEHVLRLALADGRELSVPLEWFPRLREATPQQRKNWRLIGRGEGIQRPDIDEDVSVNGLLGLPT